MKCIFANQTKTDNPDRQPVRNFKQHMDVEEKLNKKLRQRQAEGNLRHLSVPPPGTADFCSNDYLGLARNAELHQRIQAAYTAMPGVQNGATGSRLITGNSLFASELEVKLARVFDAAKTLVFNSGYAANTALLASVPQRGDTVIHDEYIHASLKEGIRLGFAQHFSFRHNDLTDLKKKLRKARGDIFVVAESVYSMDGDFAPLPELISLCETHGANLIWDEAHSTGIWGAGGNGIACASRLSERIFARIHTFGKAPGVHGACIAGSETLVEYLVNFARPLIYTTALPLHSLVSIEEAFRFLRENPHLQEQLHGKIQVFRQAYRKFPGISEHFIDSESPIQAVKIGGNARTKTVAAHLQASGFDVRPILSPTVAEGQERLRICLHTFNADTEMESMLTQLNGIFNELTTKQV